MCEKLFTIEVTSELTQQLELEESVHVSEHACLHMLTCIHVCAV